MPTHATDVRAKHGSRHAQLLPRPHARAPPRALQLVALCRRGRGRGHRGAPRARLRPPGRELRVPRRPLAKNVIAPGLCRRRRDAPGACVRERPQRPGRAAQGDGLQQYDEIVGAGPRRGVEGAARAALRRSGQRRRRRRDRACTRGHARQRRRRRVDRGALARPRTRARGFVKIDVQGVEGAVLTGALGVLREHAPFIFYEDSMLPTEDRKGVLLARLLAPSGGLSYVCECDNDCFCQPTGGRRGPRG